MNDKVFVDTNILIYAHDLDAGEKQKVASKLVQKAWEQRNGIISTQVLQEFYVNVTRKITPPLSKIEARKLLKNYSAWDVQIITPDLVLEASEIEEQHQLSFWDSMIISAARNGGAAQLLTEDLNHGQEIENIVIVNPFL
mgnify:CR=1 FL=1